MSTVLNRTNIEIIGTETTVTDATTITTLVTFEMEDAFDVRDISI